MLKQSIMANNNQLKKPYEDEIRTDFHNNRMPPVKSACTTYSIILIDPVDKGDKGYKLQILLSECKYMFEDKTIKNT